MIGLFDAQMQPGTVTHARPLSEPLRVRFCPRRAFHRLFPPVADPLFAGYTVWLPFLRTLTGRFDLILPDAGSVVTAIRHSSPHSDEPERGLLPRAL